MRTVGFLAVLLCASACSDATGAVSQGKADRGGRKMANSLAAVQKWAGKDRNVSPYGGVAVSGIELFTVGSKRAYPDMGPGQLVAVVHGNLPPLTGAQIVKAVLDAGVADPATLATVALGGQPPIVDLKADLGSAPPDQAKLAHPPAVQDHVLEAWFWSSGMAHQLSRVRVDLRTLAQQLVTANDLLRSTQDPVDLAYDDLMKGNAFGPADRLVALSATQPRAVDALNDATAHAASADARAAAAQALTKAHNGKSVAALVGALKDGDAGVRKAAADSLGAIRDATARPALTAASSDVDENVKWAAIRAIKELPAP